MFAEGDAVFNKTKGKGKVRSVQCEYEYDFPIFVVWRDGSEDTFTMGGLFHDSFSDPELDLFHYTEDTPVVERLKRLEKEVVRLSALIKGQE